MLPRQAGQKEAQGLPHIFFGFFRLYFSHFKSRHVDIQYPCIEQGHVPGTVIGEFRLPSAFQQRVYPDRGNIA